MKAKRIIAFILTAAIAFGLGFMTLAVIIRPRPLEIGVFDLNTVEDGSYIGICQNKIMFAVVRVEVVDHHIVDIEILNHKESYIEQARQTAAFVIAEQSLQVDAISGATLTRDTILKAIENALTGSRD